MNGAGGGRGAGFEEKGGLYVPKAPPRDISQVHLAAGGQGMALVIVATDATVWLLAGSSPADYNWVQIPELPGT